jgi:uncharacterized protein YndB with AHSA1/START domain
LAASLLVTTRVAASPQRAFEAFTSEIDLWWRPNNLFEFTRGRTGRLTFEPGLDGWLTETYDDGSEFEIGRITAWEPPHRLQLTWRQASFTDEQMTYVEVTFEAVSESETRVTVRHSGWDSVPQEHAARHGFPLAVFQQRHAEWWQALLASYRETLAADRSNRAGSLT